MKEEKIISINPDDRVEKTIQEAMTIYANKVKYGFYEVDVEATFQFQLMAIIQKLLNQYTLDINERFQIILEKNFPLNGINDEIDGVIKYHCNGVEKMYLIEFKYKKMRDGGPNSGNLDSYIDLYELNTLKNNSNIAGCYFIFMTDDKNFTIQSANQGTRSNFPMYDGYKITQNVNYCAICDAAKNRLINNHLPICLSFDTDIYIEYTSFDSSNNHTYWYYIAKIK